MVRQLPPWGVLLLLVTACHGGTLPMEFTLANPAATPQRTVVRVSVPVPAGALAEAPGALLVRSGRGTAAAQAHAITRHPDGSARRVMLSVPADLPARATQAFRVDPAAALKVSSLLTAREPARLKTDAYSLVVTAEQVELLSPRGERLATVAPFGPDPGGAAATLEVLDEGPQFVWLRLRRDGPEWSRELDVEVSRYGELRLTHRLQAHPEGDHWTPDFGWVLTAPGATLSGPAPAPAHVLGRDPNGRFAAPANSDLIAQLRLAGGADLSAANPLALRQNRGSFEVAATDGALTVRSNRNEPVKDLEAEGLMIQEGAWRTSELVIRPGTAAGLAAALDDPVYGHADWRLYDAVYHTGPPLQAKHPVLRACVDKMIFALQDMQMKGDDLGSMPWSWDPTRTTPDYTSAVRLNHSLYVWEDWFRGGDPRLRRVALDWLSNYYELGLYWGPKQELYGACRRGNATRGTKGHGPGTFNPRFATAPLYVHKGWSNFYLMYEETGDPRYRQAAAAAADWSIANQHAGRDYTRVIGAVADAVKLYEYTGEKKHLNNAVRIWGTFQACQGEDLLFTESGKPAAGNELYLGEDALGYQHPFVKPYIVQYATNALPYLLRHTPGDERLRRTVLALNDFMSRVQQPGGGWGYPHPATAGLTWSPEYAHGIMLAYGVEAKDDYLEAVARNLRPIAQLAELYGWPAAGLNPWEAGAGVNAAERQRRYHLATDRDASRDYEAGQVRFGLGPDGAVYFAVLLRDYLRHRSEDSLFAGDPLLEKMRHLPTTLDPKVEVPGRVTLGADGTASLTVAVTFRGYGPLPAVARVTALPPGLRAEPAEVRWTVERGVTKSPELRLRGKVEQEASVTVSWEVSKGWRGTAPVTVTPGG